MMTDDAEPRPIGTVRGIVVGIPILVVELEGAQKEDGVAISAGVLHLLVVAGIMVAWGGLIYFLIWRANREEPP